MKIVLSCLFCLLTALSSQAQQSGGPPPLSACQSMGKDSPQCLFEQAREAQADQQKELARVQLEKARTAAMEKLRNAQVNPNSFVIKENYLISESVICEGLGLETSAPTAKCLPRVR